MKFITKSIVYFIAIVTCVLYILFFFWLCHMACGILVYWPGIEPMSPAEEV